MVSLSPSSFALKKTDSLTNKSKAQKSQKRCPLKCHISIVMIPVRAAPASVMAIGFIGLGNASGDSAVGAYARYRTAVTRVALTRADLS